MRLQIFLLFITTIFTVPVSGNGILLSADSLSEHSVELEKWKYFFSDDPAMALPSFDDSKWKETNPSMADPDSVVGDFKGIGWFRLHFTTDSSINDYPVAVVMEHFGASAIYLDGVLVKTFGEIKGNNDSKYFNPNSLPFIITIRNPGSHVLAVRYANFETAYQSRHFVGVPKGFKMTLGDSVYFISERDQNSQFIPFIMALLGGIFLALSFLHLFMFLYYKTGRANLYFSLFTLFISLSFLTGFIMYGNTNPSLALGCRFLLSLLAMELHRPVRLHE